MESRSAVCRFASSYSPRRFASSAYWVRWRRGWWEPARTPDVSGLFGDIRAACAEVARRARFVAIEHARLEELAFELAAAAGKPVPLDPAQHRLAGEAATLAFVITLDAVNFGSGWFPHLRKRAGRSGYFTIAGGLRECFEREGPLSANRLASASPAECAEIFGQDPSIPEVGELMTHFAHAWRDLGELLLETYAGDFAALVSAADGSAESLVEVLTAMPLYRDVARYDDLVVPFYKRSQITATDLAAAVEGSAPGAFRDLDDLTIFADNLVPHVLRVEGVLRYDAELLARIEVGTLIEPGSREEVEMRACALHAVEEMCAALRRSGRAASAQRLDHVLWSRGQSAGMKAVPRHRTRCVFY
ncbi:MAG: hypothetical protein JRE70_15450 [Deltaproteobacteria bacterium]|nr:hypothetical protein [Deltaproteobacteria bacterium]